MSISSIITEIEGHIENAYNMLELGGADLTNVDKNIFNIEEQIKKRYFDYIVNGADEIWNNWEKVTATDVTEATLNDTDQAPMKIKLKGNTVQDGTPTPENSIPIQNVVGNVEIKIQNKNLFNENSSWNVNASIGTGSYSLGMFPFSTSGNRRTFFMICQPNTTYTFSCNTVGDRFAVFEHYSIINPLDYSSSNMLTLDNVLLNYSSNIQKEYSFTTSANAKMIAIYYSLDTIPTEIQLEQNSTATTYVEHEEQNYPFTFAEGQKAMEGTTLQDDGIHNEYKQKIFDGSNDESWNLQSINANGIANFYIVLSDYSGRRQNLALVNYFTPQTTPIAQITEEGFYIVSAKTLYIRIKSSTASTVAEFRTWLSTHNLLVEYKLAEEEIIAYSETQATQYNAIQKVYSYTDQTNISQTSEELPFILDIEALKKI